MSKCLYGSSRVPLRVHVIVGEVSRRRLHVRWSVVACPAVRNIPEWGPHRGITGSGLPAAASPDGNYMAIAYFIVYPVHATSCH
jgi:hypothetical protein